MDESAAGNKDGSWSTVVILSITLSRGDY